MRLDMDETKLIVASLEMMQRMIRDDSSVNRFEKEKVYKTVREIKHKFNNAIFCGRETTILTPDGALNPDGRDIGDPFR